MYGTIYSKKGPEQPTEERDPNSDRDLSTILVCGRESQSFGVRPTDACRPRAASRAEDSYSLASSLTLAFQLENLVPQRLGGKRKQSSKIKCDATGRARWVTGSGRPRERRGRGGALRPVGDETTRRGIVWVWEDRPSSRWALQHSGWVVAKPEPDGRSRSAESRTRPIPYGKVTDGPRNETRSEATQRQRKTKREEGGASKTGGCERENSGRDFLILDVKERAYDVAVHDRLLRKLSNLHSGESAPHRSFHLAIHSGSSHARSPELALICVMMARDEKGIHVKRGGKYLRNKSADGGVKQPKTARLRHDIEQCFLEEASTAVSIAPVEMADLKLDTLPRSQAG
ncbi:hypothetical protein B0H14DRAFT_3592872 [Mycena olivaceomarginata]|nr:hypothetical protein B0H14DRAFT_3592872 [Mycena olivaceomarginata]